MIVHLTDTKAALMGIAAVAGGAISQAFGGWDTALATLIAFMAIDNNVRPPSGYPDGWTDLGTVEDVQGAV